MKKSKDLEPAARLQEPIVILLDCQSFPTKNKERNAHRPAPTATVPVDMEMLVVITKEEITRRSN